jgi:hypothetical protein
MIDVRVFRRIAALALAAIVASAPASQMCAGWDRSAGDRMACCTSMSDGHTSPTEADRCCSMGQQRSSSEVQVAQPDNVSACQGELDRVRVTAPSTTVRRRAESDGPPRAPADHRILLSVFLI